MSGNPPDHQPQQEVEQLGPDAHVVSLNQVPLLEKRASSSRRRSHVSCLALPCCCLLVAVASAAASAAVTFMVASKLASSNTTLPDMQCPGVCAGRVIDGTFAANVTAEKDLGILTIIIAFEIIHAFDGRLGTVNVSVVPTHVEPKLIPFHHISCANVPFVLDDGCNMTWMDDCLSSAYRQDMIAGMAYVWNGTDALRVTETIDVHFAGIHFSQNFEWVEHRV